MKIEKKGNNKVKELEIKEEQDNYSIKNLLDKKQDRHEEIIKELFLIKKQVKKIRNIMLFNKITIFIIVILIALGIKIGIQLLQPVFEDYSRSFNSTMEFLSDIRN